MREILNTKAVQIHWWAKSGKVPAGITAQGKNWRFWVDFGKREWVPLFMAFRRIGPLTIMWGNRKGELG